MMIKVYSEVIRQPTFLERFRYLKLDGTVGQQTFGSDRYLNQLLYQAPEWKSIREQIIIRDNACDLGVEGYDILDRIYVHHINPITAKDIKHRHPKIFDPENLICTTFNTHNAIHYGDEHKILVTNRKPKDTKLW